MIKMAQKFFGNAGIKEAGDKYIMNTYKRYPIALVKGEGMKVWDADGKEYTDYLAGIAVTSLGYCHPAVKEALIERANTILHTCNYFYNEPAAHMAQLIVENSCFDKVFICNCGAEANESAIKLARKYQKTKGHPEKYTVVTVRNSFHGRTLATLTATGQEKVQHGFEPLPAGFDYIEFNNVECVEPFVKGRDDIAAILVEPVQGEGGCIPATKEFLAELRRVCDKYDLLLMFDEVQVGIARTGKLFAHQNYGIEPDVMTLAKALASGVPIGACCAKGDAATALQPGEHGNTFGGNPLATAAGAATLETILNDNLCDHVVKMGEYMDKAFAPLIEKYENVEGIRGMGLIKGLMLKKPGGEVASKCLEKGIIINCTAETVLRFVPPLIITEKEIDLLVKTLDEVFAELGF